MVGERIFSKDAKAKGAAMPELSTPVALHGQQPDAREPANGPHE
jgi:hypothetical protein